MLTGFTLPLPTFLSLIDSTCLLLPTLFSKRYEQEDFFPIPCSSSYFWVRGSFLWRRISEPVGEHSDSNLGTVPLWSHWLAGRKEGLPKDTLCHGTFFFFLLSLIYFNVQSICELWTACTANALSVVVSTNKDKNNIFFLLKRSVFFWACIFEFWFPNCSTPKKAFGGSLQNNICTISYY